MANFKGIYFDDDESNHTTYSRLFKKYNLELLTYEPLPERPEECYEQVLAKEVDFVVVDFDFSMKGLSYNGIDVVKLIRKHDPEIFLIYLTAKEFQQKILGEFDIAINKQEFSSQIHYIHQRINRALSRDLSIRMERQIVDAYNQRKEFFEQQLQLLKETIGQD